LLVLAELYGWKAQGTLPPYYWELDDREKIQEIDNDWNGTYFSNDNQVVSDFDAQTMADALENALYEIPDHIWECADLWNKKISILDHTKCKILDQATEINNRYEEIAKKISNHLGCLVQPNVIDSENPISYFSGDAKKYLSDFIGFCRNGAFVIC
jgi:hypothetical protein